ncbi:hypothetical protein [Phyllobacterium zundukense]|uniref:Uncharacterized protein n=1 Tax=Phyllobacterium zundukense TaxID=1867719 RepID=A0A2N9W2F5_9HYPH|nr:hypothetical protein [Phyllobacterium zundukense]ATU91109.1 hypothetical protein BLM14_05290 [Phyllobacterium zundukense]PIO45923.1 hypothetical protein B5P45_05145 [Phyllobacterium zundukense]
MSIHGNSKTGKRSAAPLLISIFWLVSTIGAALGTVYMTGPDASIATSELGTPNKSETRLAHEVDNQSTPVQRPMRVAALEALHLKIKSGLQSDSGPQDALLPCEPALVVANQKNALLIQVSSSFTLDHNSVFSARAPPLTAA